MPVTSDYWRGAAKRAPQLPEECSAFRTDHILPPVFMTPHFSQKWSLLRIYTFFYYSDFLKNLFYLNSVS